ncbi:MAG: hypothetical protein C4321_10990, partial [Chloroflexota bacterium]
MSPTSAASDPGGARRGREFFLAALSGLALVFAYAPFSFVPLAWVALAPLFLVLRRVSARRGFALGLVAGLAFFLPLILWMTALARFTPAAYLGWFLLA